MKFLPLIVLHLFFVTTSFAGTARFMSKPYVGTQNLEVRNPDGTGGPTATPLTMSLIRDGDQISVTWVNELGHSGSFEGEITRGDLEKISAKSSYQSDQLTILGKLGCPGTVVADLLLKEDGTVDGTFSSDGCGVDATSSFSLK